MIVVAILVVVAIAGLAIWAMQRRRSQELRRRFGPEYERTVESAQDRRQAEADLRARQERVDALEIRPLDAADEAREPVATSTRRRTRQDSTPSTPPVETEQPAEPGRRT